MKARKACAAMGLAGKKSIFWETSVKGYSLIDGELMWGDFDLIFPVMDLYHNSICPRAS